METTIYCLSGLGADHRVFSLLDVDADLVHIPWKKPLLNEDPSEYMARISSGFEFKQPFYILGLSFGGLMLHHLMKLHSPQGLILISTAKRRNDIPICWRFLLWTGLFSVLPLFMYKSPPPFVSAIFGVKNGDEKRMLKTIIRETDPHFSKWAIQVVQNWSPVSFQVPLIRIHGNKDKLLNVRKEKGTSILNGGHLVIRSRAKAVSRLINDFVKK